MSDVTGQVIEPMTYRTDSDVFNHYIDVYSQYFCFSRNYSYKVSDELSNTASTHQRQSKSFSHHAPAPTYHRRGRSEGSPLMTRGDVTGVIRHSHSTSAGPNSPPHNYPSGYASPRGESHPSTCGSTSTSV